MQFLSPLVNLIHLPGLAHLPTNPVPHATVSAKTLHWSATHASSVCCSLNYCGKIHLFDCVADAVCWFMSVDQWLYVCMCWHQLMQPAGLGPV